MHLNFLLFTFSFVYCDLFWGLMGWGCQGGFYICSLALLVSWLFKKWGKWIWNIEDYSFESLFVLRIFTFIVQRYYNGWGYRCFFMLLKDAVLKVIFLGKKIVNTCIFCMVCLMDWMQTRLSLSWCIYSSCFFVWATFQIIS